MRICLCMAPDVSPAQGLENVNTERSSSAPALPGVYLGQNENGQEEEAEEESEELNAVVDGHDVGDELSQDDNESDFESDDEHENFASDSPNGYVALTQFDENHTTETDIGLFLPSFDNDNNTDPRMDGGKPSSSSYRNHEGFTASDIADFDLSCPHQCSYNYETTNNPDIDDMEGNAKESYDDKFCMILPKDTKEEAELRSTEMTAAKAKTIKEAMANFHLPNSSIPEWATIIPEGKWKEKLLSVNKEK